MMTQRVAPSDSDDMPQHRNWMNEATQQTHRGVQ